MHRIQPSTHSPAYNAAARYRLMRADDLMPDRPRSRIGLGIAADGKRERAPSRQKTLCAAPDPDPPKPALGPVIPGACARPS
jgi:hypothetical protein